LERLDELARTVLMRATDEATRASAAEVDVRHILVALADEGSSKTARALAAVGITVDTVRETLPRVDTKFTPSGPPSLGPDAERVLDHALDQAQYFRYELVTPELLLLGVAQQEKESGEELFEALGTDAEAVHDEMIRLLFPPEQPSQKDAVAQPPPLVPRLLEAAPTHTDRPAMRDRLGRQKLAEVLAERIRRVRNESTEIPVRTRRERRAKLHRDARAARQTGSFLLHIHAPWGAGKSSLLNFLGEQLRNRSGRWSKDPRLSQWIVVEFSAWEHQRLAPPWWWLLAAIRRCASRELRKFAFWRWLWFWVRDVAWRVWNSRAAWLSVVLVAALAVIAWVFDWFGLEGSSLTALQTTAATVTALLTLATVGSG
jgi:hypothetical protein